MERLTTRHNGVAVIKDKNKHKEAMEKLARYEELEEQGLLPRFHLGDEFWTIRLGKILKARIVMLQQKKDGSWQYRLSREITSEYHDTVNCKESKFGKTVFLTKAEAEKALAEMRGE